MLFLSSIAAQDHFNMTLLSNISLSDEASDIWGYVDDQGIEYAVISTYENVLIYSLLDPSNPQLTADIPVEGSSWHDMKSYGKYIYHVSESDEDGITIINMSDINNITHTLYEPYINLDQKILSVHNIFIDEFGVLYACGSNVEGGTIFFDLYTDPEEPPMLGYQHDNYTHDVYVRKNIMYSSQIFEGTLEMYDVSDKSNPERIAGFESSNTFTHNSWLSDDGNFVFTTDERANSFVDAYDISDLSNIERVDKINSETGNDGVIPHNTHYRDGFLITSWYTDGVVVTDATRPDILVNVGRYDTFISDDTGFDGCWGVYPFLPSGIIIASDISEGLFVLQPNYQHASYIEGTVTNAISGIALNQTEITIESTSVQTNGNAAGQYKAGIAESGSYIVTASRSGFVPQSKKVILVPGQTHILDFQLYDNTLADIDNDMDGYSIINDCDDNNEYVNPGIIEILYNGLDDDCNPATLDDDIDQDGFASANDCDDFDPAINPSIAEIPYNAVDDDCNPATLDDDLDQDGFLGADDCDDDNPGIFPNQTEAPYNGFDDDCNPATLDDDLDQDGYLAAEDCDDNDANINPSLAEIPNNNIDENCDGITLIIDEDNDGFNSDEDCDDMNADTNPEASEIANNNIDENCDGIILIIDADNDGYNSSEDCDESNPNINPGAIEIPNNNIDENCDGIILNFDADGDGYNTDEDCNDADPNISPAATEIPNNNIDEDCDGIALVIDFDNDGFNSDEDCNESNPNINPAATEIPNNNIDEDCDGLVLVIDNDNDGYNSDEDCDDTNPNINPSSTEIPNNSIDEDCNGEALVIDFDNDGFNSDEDCNESNPNINPAATEIPNNNIDEDCDGIVLVIDNDNDGFNSDEDCDDNNADINPAAEEIVNNEIDEDCDGVDLVSATDDLIELALNIYPNPTNDKLHIDLEKFRNYHLKIFNASGQEISSSEFQGNIIIDCNNFNEGIYFVEILDKSNFSTTSKLFIKI